MGEGRNSIEAEKLKADPTKRPKMNLVGMDGNIFVVLGNAYHLLRKNGMKEAGKEMWSRVEASGNYYQALGIISEYVQTELTKERAGKTAPKIKKERSGQER